MLQLCCILGCNEKRGWNDDEWDYQSIWDYAKLSQKLEGSDCICTKKPCIIEAESNLTMEKSGKFGFIPLY